MAILQVRNVPDELYERARERARARGMSLSRYVIGLLEQDSHRLTFDEWTTKRRRLPPRPSRDIDVLAALDAVRDDLETRSLEGRES